MIEFLLLFAQGEEKKAAEGAPWWSMLVWILPLIFLFYFLMIRPQQQQQKRMRAMMESMKKNDRVVTHSGIIGVVSNMTDNEVTLRLEEGKMKVVKTAIARVLTEEENQEDMKKE